MVDGTGLENRQGVKAFEGSNPSLSAKCYNTQAVPKWLLRETCYM